jgi:acyl-CoA reductase-like NAD-dependent aldehyde dehydrogenase
MAIRDDSEVYSCDITPHGKARRIYTSRTPVLGCISAITPFNHPLNMISHKIAPAIATNNRVVAKPTELTPADRAAAGRHPLRGRAAARDAVGRDGQSAHHGRCHDRRPNADIVTFTGSVKVGKYIAEKAGYKRLGARARRQRPADRHGGRRPRQGRPSWPCRARPRTRDSAAPP